MHAKTTSMLGFLFFFFIAGCVISENSFSLLQGLLCPASLLPPNPALCCCADFREHKRCRATHSTLKTASRAARSLFNSCGRTQMDVVAFWKCSFMFYFCFFPLTSKTKKKRKKYRNTFLVLGRPCSFWAVFKKKKEKKTFTSCCRRIKSRMACM